LNYTRIFPVCALGKVIFKPLRPSMFTVKPLQTWAFRWLLL